MYSYFQEVDKNNPHSLTLFEKKIKTLKEINEVLGDRPAVVARELTKMNEEIIRGTVSYILSYFNNKKPRGEFVIMIGKNNDNVFFK